jgi:ABC-type Mn2+/Zn2+ transport system ATPase subunit
MVALAGIRKRYRGRGEVLAGVDLTITPGVPVSVAGGNGAGKSTLLRIVAGCASPSSGRVSGRPPVVGYLPQALPPPPRMTVLAYLGHHAAMHGTARRAPASHAVLDDLGFTGDRNAPLAALSAGNLQKVGLAQALGCDAGLVVLDEPWTALDLDAVPALEHHLARAAAGRALLLADHTGRAGALPGACRLRLVDGLLTEDTGARRAWTTIMLRCPGDPSDTLAALPPVTRSWREDGLLGLRLPADGGDALLAAALGLRCSVVAVRRDR